MLKPQNLNQGTNQNQIPTWEYKGIKYPLYPVEDLQCAVTEVAHPESGEVIGYMSHFFTWESEAPYNEHQASMVMREEKLPGNRGTRESNPDIIGADSKLYVEIIHSGEYVDAAPGSVPVQLTRDEMLNIFDDDKREDRSRAIREFFDITIETVTPDYKSGLDLLRTSDGTRKYAIKVGNPLKPVAVMVVSMNKSDIQSRTNYEATIRDTIDTRKGQLPVAETTYNLQAQTNFGKKFFAGVDDGALFRGKKFDAGEIADPAEQKKYIAAFLSKLCPKWIAMLGDKHYSSAARTQGKS